MAEGWARHLKPGFEVFSAGAEKSYLDPLAVFVMREAGIDISHQHSKALAELPQTFDLIVTLCDTRCPVLPGKILHHPFEDPRTTGQLELYRRVRDQIKAFVNSL